MRKAVFSAVFAVILCGAVFAAPIRAGEGLGAGDIPARIAEAEVGEWVLYRLANGRRSRLTVVEKWSERGETFLRIENEVANSRNRNPRRSEEVVEVGEAVRDLRTLGPEDRVDASEILLHGRSLDVVVVSYYENGRLVRQSYLSDAIPVYGLVKGVTPDAKNKTTLVVLDYGFAEDD